MHYTLRYTEGNEIDCIKSKEQYSTIKECVDWAKYNGIDYYLLSITEWGDELDGYGTPEINASVNLQAVADDEQFEDLSKYY